MNQVCEPSQHIYRLCHLRTKQRMPRIESVVLFMICSCGLPFQILAVVRFDAANFSGTCPHDEHALRSRDRWLLQQRTIGMLVKIARIFAVPREPTTRTVSPGFSFSRSRVMLLPLGRLCSTLPGRCHMTGAKLRLHGSAHNAP
jgi:hypothetical protein